MLKQPGLIDRDLQAQEFKTGSFQHPLLYLENKSENKTSDCAKCKQDVLGVGVLYSVVIAAICYIKAGCFGLEIGKLTKITLGLIR